MSRHTRPGASRRARTLRPVRPAFDALEDRTLLSVNIPQTVAPFLANQALFAPSSSLTLIDPGPSTQLYRFVTDGQSPSVSASFSLKAATAGSSVDAGLALYDSNGNQIASANQNLLGQPGTEQ